MIETSSVTRRLSVKIVTPVRVDEKDLLRRAARYQAAASPEISIDFVNLANAPISLVTDADMRSSEAALAREIQSTRGEQVDAILFDCVLDQAIRELRRACEVPLFGPTQCTIGLLSQVSDDFSIIARTQAHCELMRRGIEASGFGIALRDMHILGISDEESRNPEIMEQALRPKLRAAEKIGPRHAVVMGSTTIDVPQALRAEFSHLKLLCPGLVALETICLLWREGGLGTTKRPL